MPLWNSYNSSRNFSRFSAYLLFTLRRESKIEEALFTASIHDHSPIRSCPNPILSSSEVWFVKVVCTLCIRFASTLDILSSDYFKANSLTPSIAFNVIRFITVDRDNPLLAFNFFQLTRTNLQLIHSFATYNLLLRSLCQMGLHDSAKLVCECMMIDGHAPDSSFLGFLVSSFAYASKFDIARRLLAQAQSNQDVNISSYVYNNFLNLLVKKNRVNEAVSFFREHVLSSQCFHVDTCAFNIVIRGLCRVGEVDKALKFYDDMESFGCLPDLITYNTLINGLCLTGEVDKGCKLLREIQSGNRFSPDVVTYTSVISGYCKLGNMEVAAHTFTEMINSGTKSNEVTFNVLIDGFGKKGDMVSALSMYEKMISLGCPPDVVTFTSLIDGYCRIGQVDEGLKLWDEMVERNLTPNVYTFAIIINALCKENRLNEARTFLGQLKWREDIIPLPFIYNPVIDGFCKAGNVEEANMITAEMEAKKCNPDKITFTILIIGHCMKGRIREAINIFNKMLEVGCAPDKVTVNSFLSCLLKAGMPNEAFKVMQTVSTDLSLGMSSRRITMPCRKNIDIPVAV